MLSGAADAWGERGFRVNVLQPVSNFPGEQDVIPARAFVAWTKEAFLVRVEVDTTQTLEAEDDKKLWLGDSVELFLSAGDGFKQTSQVIIAPGLDPAHPAMRELIWKTPAANPDLFKIKTSAQRTAAGYAVEYSLPWAAFGVTPDVGVKCLAQVIVNHDDRGIMRHLGWYPGIETGWRPEQNIHIALGDTGSPAVNSMARAMVLTPRMGRAFYMLANPAEQGHLLTVRYQGQVLHSHKIEGNASYYEAFFSLPENWSDTDPIEVCDNEDVLASWMHAKGLLQIQTLADDLDYRMSPCVFYEPEFPHGGFDQDAIMRRFFDPIKITTTFYDSQYHEVTKADKPGRYGAVVRIKVKDCDEIDKFITLYRIPEKVDWRVASMPIAAQFPPILGLNPAVVRNQQQAVGSAIKNAFVGTIYGNADPAILFSWLSETPAGAPPAVARNNAWARNDEWWYGLRKQLGMEETYPYLTDLPADYDADPNKKWPLILFLHGLGDGPHVRNNGLARLMGEGKQLPAIVITPECPVHGWWKSVVLSHLLDDLATKYRIDPDRIYLTGLSMGGFGTWSLALYSPERFAAIAPICGGGDPPDAARLRNMPIWAFHGDADEIVPVTMTLDMVAAVRKAGGHPHLTIYPGVNHVSWDRAYGTDALYTWLLAQKRGQPEVKTPGIPSP